MSEPTRRLVRADALELARSLPTASIDAIYLDPPFFTGRAHRMRSPDGKELRTFSDAWPDLESYLSWMRERLVETHRLLREDGVLFVHLDGRAAHYVKCELDRIFGYDQFLSEIIWCFETGGVAKDRFPRKHQTILHYGRGKKARFFPQKIRKNLKHRMMRKGVPEFEDPVTGQWFREKFCPDWWTDIDVVRRDSHEWVGYPTQKPEKLLERILASTTRPGEVVLDLMCGSGVTCVVAEKLGRSWIGGDVSPEAIALAARRLESLGARFVVEDGLRSRRKAIARSEN